MTTHDPRLLHKGVLAVRRNTIRRLLHTVFGIEHLRDGQQRVIDSVLDGKDTLAIMPTGSGKSLCYQIPARILAGMTVVVSPLISLMKDQLEKLGELGIRAVQVNSSLTAEEERRINYADWPGLVSKSVPKPVSAGLLRRFLNR